MPSVTLLAKIYSDAQLNQVSRELESILEGLRVEVKVRGANPRGWVQASVSGEDQNVAIRYLADKIGLCPEGLENISKYSTFRGFITDLSRSRSEVLVDFGISSPRSIDATIPLHLLQTQLGDGRKIALAKLVELYGFCDRLPLNIRITAVDSAKKYVEAELSEKQQKQYADWTHSLLDRLLILGASSSEVDTAVERAESVRDIVRIEPLGMFEHAMACKLGTDAAGLVPRIGRELRKATLSVFNPRKVLGLLGGGSASSIS